MTSFPPIPEGDLPETRGEDGKHHVGCVITQQRAIVVAMALFPDEVADGSDCHNQYGREGEPCEICASRNASWTNRVAEVRRAMIKAFS